MKNLHLFALSCALLALGSVTAFAQQSLYERLGGKEAITAVVDEFAGRCLADTRINQKFANSDPARLKQQPVEQICAATGGPCQYTGRDMKAAHLNMGVTEGEFNALVEDLTGALDKFNVPLTEKNELLGLLAPMKASIVELNSSATGTPLPKKFKAYKAPKAGKAAKAAKEPKPAKETKVKKGEAAKEEPAKDATVKQEETAKEDKKDKGKKSKKDKP